MNPRLALVAASMVIAFGCGGPGSGESPSPAPRAVDYRRVIVHPMSFNLDSEVIDLARERLVARCMRGRGHVYEVVPLPVSLMNGVPQVHLDYRRRHGYGWATARRRGDRNEVPSRVRDPAFARDLGVDGAEMSAVKVPSPTGSITVQAGGCLRQASRQVAGSMRDYVVATQVVEAYTFEAIVALDDAPEGAEAMARWSACMRRRGYRFEGPGKAMTSMGMLVAGAPELTEELVRAEVSLAVADGRCQIQVGFERVLIRIRARYADRLPPRARADLERVVRVRAKVLARARRVP